MSKCEPFRVFISCDQTEFQDLRKDLQDKIDKESFHDQRVMQGITIEDEHGDVIVDKITAKIEGSSIYVGIFGREKSDWTCAEYLAASARDIPLLIYYYKKPLRRGRPRARERRGRPSEVIEFLDKHVKPWITINGYDSPYTSAAALTVDILNHLAIQTSKMVVEAANIRKTIHKGTVFPSP